MTQTEFELNELITRLKIAEDVLISSHELADLEISGDSDMLYDLQTEIFHIKKYYEDKQYFQSNK